MFLALVARWQKHNDIAIHRIPLEIALERFAMNLDVFHRNRLRARNSPQYTNVCTCAPICPTKKTPNKRAEKLAILLIIRGNLVTNIPLYKPE